MLLDVGVWLAAAWDGQVHHPRAAAWFEAQADEMFMCRVTQMGLLRLLSNPAVMGEAALTRSEAWKAVDHFRADERVRWAVEPPELEQVWRAFSARNDSSHKLWTDDYLAAFAQTARLPVATLDRAFAGRYPSIRVHRL